MSVADTVFSSVGALTAAGAALAALLALGLVLVVSRIPALRPPRVAARVEPYVRRRRLRSGLLSREDEATGLEQTLRALAGPIVGRISGLLDRLGSGTAGVQRRLEQAGGRLTIESFRTEQILWGLGGSALGAVLALGLVTQRGLPPLLAALVIIGSLVGGLMARDAALTRAVTLRSDRMLREFPAVADLLALAVAAGEGPVAAMERVARTSRGDLPDEFILTVNEIRSGVPVRGALFHLGRRTPLSSLGRFTDGISVALDRGTPLADVLRAQATDAREEARRELMETAGKREIAMLVPVVFFILPLVILFAVLPGLSIVDLRL